MRVLVQGPGAIGTWLACSLTTRGESVTLLDHDVARAKRLSGSSFVLETPAGDGWRAQSMRIPIVAGPRVGRCEEPFDLLIVCVKNRQVGSALSLGTALLRSTGHVLVLANGLGHESALADHWTPEQAWLGVVTYGALLLEPGRVRLTGDGLIRIGCGEMNSTTLEARVTDREMLSRLFGSSGVNVDWVEDPVVALWEKAIVNCALNPVAAIAGLTNGELRANPVFAISRALAAETAQVASTFARSSGRAWRSELSGDQWGDFVDDVCRRTSTNRCSMLRDLETGRRTEIDALNGAVAERARELGLSAPLNRVMTTLVRTAECGEQEGSNE